MVISRCALRSLRLASHSRIFRSRLFQLIIPFVLQRFGFQTFTHYRKGRGLVNLEIESDPNISHCSQIARSCARLNPEILRGLSLVLLSSFSSRLGARIKDRTERTRHITQPLTRSRVLFPCPFQHQLQTWSSLNVSGRCALRYLRLYQIVCCISD